MANGSLFAPSQMTVPYVEVVDNFAPSQGNFGWDDTQVQQVIDLTGSQAWDNVELAVQCILGVHYREGDSLIRHPPLRHPKYPWLYAIRASVQGLVPDATNPKDNDISGLESARYKRPRIAIVYQALPFEPYFRSQQDEGKEWQRYVIKLPQISTDAIQIERGALKYIEGTAGAPNGLDVPGNTAGLQKMIPRGVLTWTWMQVPDRYLMNSAGIPVNFFGDGNTVPPAIGSVNATTFAGYPAGCLLMLAPHMTPCMAPAPFNFDNQLDLVRAWNVQVNMALFDPPLGTGATTHGWNTAIWPGDLKNYKIVSKVGAHLLYSSVEFANCFAAAPIS